MPVEKNKIDDGAPAANEAEKPPRELELKQPITVKGKQVAKLCVNPDKLTAAAITRTERMFYQEFPDYPESRNIFNAVTFWLMLGAYAVGIPYSAVEDMDVDDAMSLGGMVKTVFFGQ